MSIQNIDRNDYPSNGPRVTPEAIEANIASEHYFTAEQGVLHAQFLEDGPLHASIEPLPKSLRLLTICVLVLQNGFTVTGESACADPKNFDPKIGKRVAKQNAVNKIWPLMGYELRTKLANMPSNDMGEALTMLTAHRLGNPAALTAGHADTILSHFEGRSLKEEGAN